MGLIAESAAVDPDAHFFNGGARQTETFLDQDDALPEKTDITGEDQCAERKKDGALKDGQKEADDADKHAGPADGLTQKEDTHAHIVGLSGMLSNRRDHLLDRDRFGDIRISAERTDAAARFILGEHRRHEHDRRPL